MRHHGHWHGFDDILQAQQAAHCQPLDLLGNGHFSHQASPLTVRAQAQHVIQQIRILDRGGDIYVLAVSLGCLVALDALLSPISPVLNAEQDEGGWLNRVRGVVLVNPSVRGSARLWERLRPVSWPVVLRHLLWLKPQDFEQDLVALTINRTSLHAAVLAENMKAQVRFPTTRRNALAQLVSAARFSLGGGSWRSPVPMLLMSSQGDRLVSWQCGERLARQLQARFVVHPDAGHDLTTDAPQWVLSRVQDWLATDGRD